MSLFLERFDKKCKEIGKTASFVVTKCGISRQSHSAWKKRDSIPNGATLKKIADYFGVSVNYFLEEDAVEQQKLPLNAENTENDPKDDSIKEELSEREWCALQLFRSLTEEQKTSIMATLFKMHYKAQE